MARVGNYKGRRPKGNSNRRMVKRKGLLIHRANKADRVRVKKLEIRPGLYQLQITSTPRSKTQASKRAISLIRRYAPMEQVRKELEDSIVSIQSS